MKIETLKQSHLKRNIIIGVVAVLIISAVILNFTRAKYRVTQSIPLVNGTINYSLADLNIVAITVDGENVDTIPDGNYELTENSYCTVDGEEDSSISISYDSNTKNLTVTPFTTKGTKCYLDFVTATTKKVDTILGTIEVNLDKPDFSKTAQADCSGKSNCEETNGIYEETTSKGTTYYWRGDVDNNWVSFAGFYWRIIRINEDGTIRMIYQGTSVQTTGTGTQIGKSSFNSSMDDNMYVGYMYTENEAHGLSSSSTIKKELDNWYRNNLQNYADKIDTNAGFCGDREPSGNGGTGTTETYYAGYSRLKSRRNPTLECKNNSDLYTTKESNQGNKALDYPIGLITADEVAYAGATSANGSNESFYLYTGQIYWTMTPCEFSNYVTSMLAFLFPVGRGGRFDTLNGRASLQHGVRPVINLKADITISGGDGTASNPYVVAT